MQHRAQPRGQQRRARAVRLTPAETRRVSLALRRMLETESGTVAAFLTGAVTALDLSLGLPYRDALGPVADSVLAGLEEASVDAARVLVELELERDADTARMLADLSERDADLSALLATVDTPPRTRRG